MAVTYYITFISPETGFLEREEFQNHSEMMDRVNELKRKLVPVQHGHFRT